MAFSFLVENEGFGSKVRRNECQRMKKRRAKRGKRYPSLSARREAVISVRYGRFSFRERCEHPGSVKRKHAQELIPSMLERNRPKAAIPPSPPGR